MQDPQPDDRAALAKAYQWAGRIMTISLEMVVPGLLGYWLDTKLGTQVVFLLLGFAGGMTLALWHLIKITHVQPKPIQAGKARSPRNDSQRDR